MHWPEWGVASISRSSAFISSRVEAAAGADGGVAGERAGDLFQPLFQRQRGAGLRDVVGEIAQQPLDVDLLPSIAGTSRTSTASGPKLSTTRPSSASSPAREATRSTSAGSRSTTSGISSGWRAMPPLAMRALHALIDEALMRGVLIDDDDAVGGLRDDIGLVQLRARERRAGVVPRRTDPAAASTRGRGGFAASLANNGA